MKVRYDFVTNSSSSSFIISKKDVDRRKLKTILLKLANEMNRYQWDEEEDVFTMEDFEADCSISNFYVRNCSKSKPYMDEFGFSYDDHWYISNHVSIRYDWGVVEDVLSEYELPLIRGYCD